MLAPSPLLAKTVRVGFKNEDDNRVKINKIKIEN